MALTVLAPTPAAGKGIPVNWFTDLVTAINNVGSGLDRTYAAGDFTAGGSQTWTVDSGDVTTNFYWRFEKTIVYALTVTTTSVGGTPSGDLKVSIPLGLTASKSIIHPIKFSNNGTLGDGVAITTAGQTTIQFLRDLASTNWSAATNNTSIWMAAFRIPTTT